MGFGRGWLFCGQDHGGGRWTAGDEFSLCGRNIDGIWRKAAEGSTLGGAQRAPPVCFANTLVRLFAPQGQTLLTPRFRSAQPWPLFATPPYDVKDKGDAKRDRELTQGCGPGMPGPYGVAWTGGGREGQGRAAARPLSR